MWILFCSISSALLFSIAVVASTFPQARDHWFLLGGTVFLGVIGALSAVQEMIEARMAYNRLAYQREVATPSQSKRGGTQK